MLLGVVLTVAVLIGIAVLILAFERRRAEEIERDLADQERGRRDRPASGEDSSAD